MARAIKLFFRHGNILCLQLQNVFCNDMFSFSDILLNKAVANSKLIVVLSHAYLWRVRVMAAVVVNDLQDLDLLIVRFAGDSKVVLSEINVVWSMARYTQNEQVL